MSDPVEERGNLCRQFGEDLRAVFGQRTPLRPESLRELFQIELPADELFGEALLHMQTNRETIARVVSEGQGTIGILSIDQLTDPLLKGQLGSLRR